MEVTNLYFLLDKCSVFVFSRVQAGKSGKWNVNIEMRIRPSKSTGVLFALVYNNTVPLSVAVVEKGDGDVVGSLTFLFFQTFLSPLFFFQT